MNKFYITNAIPYVNARPHIGHALEFIQSDTIARFQKTQGKNVILSCGYDENSLKNVQAAEAEGISVQELVDKNGKLFFDLWDKLGTKFDKIVKGSDSRHIESSQKLWQLCEKNKDIYKKTYTGLYCVGCEQFYTKEELDKNRQCFEHPGKPLEKVSEENYFFKLSKYTDKILKLIVSNGLEIVPEFRKNEIISFVKNGLEDISISRSNERAKNWGVPVPNDPTQKIYVWFDALNIYQTSVGFGWDPDLYKKLWPADLHVIGKGIIRFHAVYWPAFLLSAGLLLPKKLFVHEYFTVNGQKMSKTLGNVIDPVVLIEKYGADALRYYCLAKFSPFSDGDFSESKFTQVYNSDLANGLGNLVARVAKLCETSGFKEMSSDKSVHMIDIADEYKKALEEYRFNDALNLIFQKISRLDKYINEEKPWELLKISTNHKGRELSAILAHSVDQIVEIAILLSPFMPATSEIIKKQFSQVEIKSQDPLFPRI
ncbi:MAG: Methionine-tRNA ligase [Candidatus Levybacteria bacterium GW2011_GWB1_35_5]|nr:MAG: Methionine-tRNA ligase [Candidatus Levybacteria bacterium GW2011_GWB1_35_5]